ncbi:vicilin Car i 2.0101-like [Solanum verrucosum]|uniref:vicilin Car i 2.0101-like n=1 Tax=Solanum verrucosum TaxID=315347 RepID=UPI0020CFF4C8|nr:vicilin Car i 2.0101-like [Solanum verrucosum]
MAIFTKLPKLLFVFFFLLILISMFIACQCECDHEKENNNPYLFESHMFKSRFKSKHGEFRVLNKFTQLLRGIENYRVGVLEFEPLSFMLPHHFDAQLLLLIVRGRGSVSIAEEDEKNSFNLEHGDVISVSAGSTIYFTNTDNKEKFSVYVLAKAVNVPGKFQEFFSAGSENQETFYRAFSNDILETAFNTPRNRLERLFGQQKQGIIIKASEEKIRAISQPGSRSIRGETRGPVNVLNQRPLIGNRFGQYFEAAPERFEHLRDLDVAVGIMNINQGGMILPVYNTRTTWLVMVAQGNGRFEMVSSQSQERRGHNYQKAVRGCLSVGDFFVIPAGYPITVIANGDSNLRMVGFGINGHNNMLNFLAGQESIWRNVNREAKELSFNMPAREVEEIL